MKKILPLLLIFCLLVYSCADKTKENAVVYNDAVIREVDKADSLIQILFAFEMFDRFPEMQQSFTQEFSEAKNNLQSIKPMENDDSLRQEAITLIDGYVSILQGDYKNIYEIMRDSVYTPADSIEVDSLMFAMYSKWEIQSASIAAQQKRFADKYGIMLEYKNGDK